MKYRAPNLSTPTQFFTLFTHFPLNIHYYTKHNKSKMASLFDSKYTHRIKSSPFPLSLSPLLDLVLGECSPYGTSLPATEIKRLILLFVVEFP